MASTTRTQKLVELQLHLSAASPRSSRLQDDVGVRRTIEADIHLCNTSVVHALSLPPETLLATFRHMEFVDLRSAAFVCRKWNTWAKEARWSEPSDRMLDWTPLENRHLLAGKVKRLVLHRPQDFEMRWTFPKLHVLIVETNVLLDRSALALPSFLDRCCGPALPPNVIMYSRNCGVVPNPYRWIPAEVALRTRELASIAQRPGLKRLCVWPALLHKKTVAPSLRKKLGRSTFPHLESLTTRVSATSVSDVLSLVPHLTELDLQVIHNAAAQSENVLSIIAERLPHLRRLTVRYGGDFAVDFDSLVALARRRTLTALELRVSRPRGYMVPDLQLGGRRWEELLALLPNLEQLWLPGQCSVVDAAALNAAGRHCPRLRLVHLHNAWDLSSLGAPKPAIFPHLTTVVVDSVGPQKQGEGAKVPSHWTASKSQISHGGDNGEGNLLRMKANVEGGGVGMERKYRLIELTQRATTLVDGLLAHAPQLKNMRLRCPTMLDVAVFRLFSERTKMNLGSSPWDICRGGLAGEEWM